MQPTWSSRAEVLQQPRAKRVCPEDRERLFLHTGHRFRKPSRGLFAPPLAPYIKSFIIYPGM